MENKNIILIILIGLIIVLAAAFTTYVFTQGEHKNITIVVENKTNNTSPDDNVEIEIEDNTNSGDNSKEKSSNGVISVIKKLNKQAGDGSSYNEVNYEDGGMRQYDTETGKLIGSTYEEDQGRNGGPLPSMI